VTDENVNNVENEEKRSCGTGCCDGGSDGTPSGGSGFKGLLFLIVIVLAGLVAANSILNKNKTGRCVGGACPGGSVAADACDVDKQTACPAAADEADAKTCSSSSEPADDAAVCSSEPAKEDTEAGCSSMAK